MKLTNNDIKAIKKLFKEMIKSRSSEALQFRADQCRHEIDFAFETYNIPGDSEFAKENKFCTDCGNNLNEDNVCIFCGRNYGW